MSHQPTIPQRQFSPAQHSPPNYQLPPNKRPKLSPGPSNPASPYPNYATSPGPTTPAATPNTIPSPATVNHPNNQAPLANYNTPYQANGRPGPAGVSLTIPSAPSIQPAVSTPTLASPQIQTPNTSYAPYSNAKLAPVPTPTTSSTPILAAPMLAAAPINSMGPPALNPSGSFSGDATKKAAASKSTDTYDPTDVLASTGINLEEEAELLRSTETRGFPSYAPGGRDSLYGAGPANQPAEYTDARTQEELAAESADRAWNDAAARLARSRTQEITSHLLEPGVVHKRMQDVAQKFGLGLNLDTKADGQRYMGRLVPPSDFPKPEIKVVYQETPTSGVVHTLGSFIPADSFLVDQIALLSISTKQRMRELISDANRVATTRQTSSHGVIPSEWLDAAAPETTANGTQDDAPRTGAESAVSPRTNPLKRPADELSNGLPTPVSETSPANPLVDIMTSSGKTARNTEEGRLKKRLKREQQAAEKDKEGAEGSSRAGSVAPGTPGSTAPETGEVKAPTKKESKKLAKLAEASSTTVNTTLSLFAGGKKKKYSWMNAGGPASGASTPRPAPGVPGTPGSTSAAASKASQGPLTKAGVTHLGQFREDSDKGKNIQVRDWVTALEHRGFEQKLLQDMYNIMDQSAKSSVEGTIS
ncbi:hypothetical protein GGR52DRAFT_527203 [Hypoxylon sp. FL1284]|nr:hypothetical protein GGR52DRAFT_527203 [Hypoxylon sp. FL1284]